MTTEKKLRLEQILGARLLLYSLKDRNKMIDIIIRNYKEQLGSLSVIKDWYEIEEWKTTEEQFQSLRFYHAEDFVPYQSYLPQIFAYHKQYLCLDHASKVEMLESLFLNRFYSYITPRARIELLRELGNLYCQKQGIDFCKLVVATTLPNHADMLTFSGVIENGEVCIAVLKDILNYSYRSGIRLLEEIYHELDHFYLLQKAQRRDLSREEYVTYLSSLVDQQPILQKFYLGYMFLPVERRAIVHSHQRVSEILRSNPYVNEEDEVWWGENQFIKSRKELTEFNIEHQVYLTENQLTEFMGSIAVEYFERKNGTSLLSSDEREKHKEKAMKFRRIWEK